MVDAHAVDVRRYLYRRLVGAADPASTADDLTADVLVIAWRRRADVPAGAELPWLYAVARRVLALDWPRNVLVNVNFPDVVAASVRGVRVTHTGTRGFGGHIVERKDPRGGTYYWIGYAPQESEIDAASDIAAVRSGHISVTPLHLDLTHESMRRKLVAEFEAQPIDLD